MEQLPRLLEKTNRLIEDQKRTILKDRNLFNVFDILKLSTNETRTHSAFIGELLNPNGSHLLGSQFLETFLEVIGETDNFSSLGVQIQLEKHIGEIDYEKLRGGRVDIMISNTQGQTICIENKIYAKLQQAQLERNINHNRKSNKVLFLTLKTQTDLDMSEEFNGKLLNITYEEHILKWLEKSISQLNLYPLLRESLNQYVQLIKKLTGQLSNKNSNLMLNSIILENISAARYIYENYEKVLTEVKSEFQNDVYSKLAERFNGDTKWEVKLGNTANYINAQIWLQPRSGKKLWFGIETFSGRGNFCNRLIQGIISIEQQVALEDFNMVFCDLERQQRGWWYDINDVYDQNSQIINFNDEIYVARIASDPHYRAVLAEHIVNNFMYYFDDNSEKVLSLV